MRTFIDRQSAIHGTTYASGFIFDRFRMEFNPHLFGQGFERRLTPAATEW
jgi:hypothetical protein